MADPTTYLPGPELKDKLIRETATRYVRELGCRYDPTFKHARLYHPTENVFYTLAKTPSDWRGRLNTLAGLRRMFGALAEGESPALRRSVSTPVFDDGMGVTVESPWTKSEWRELQREHDAWWRRQYAGPERAPAEPEPVQPAPLPAATRELLARLARGTEVKDDARGDKGFTLVNARQMVKDGYSIDHVIARTGWGRAWLADLAERLDDV